MEAIPAWLFRVTGREKDNLTEEATQKSKLKFKPAWRANEPFPLNSALIHVTNNISNNFFEHHHDKPDYFLKITLDDTTDDDIHVKNIAEFVKSISNKADYLICCGFWEIEIIAAVKIYLYGFPKTGYSNQSVYEKILSALRYTTHN